jgi:HicA toxin of bacterial toxin-antitoxin,
LGYAGYVLKRQGKGDHEIWWHPITAKRLTVDHGIKSRDTANAILKEAGLPKQF